ncbi:MAG: hypothetical protein PHN89_05845 [Candidatus Pacebacteria bacterium]|nr:hypothetical protein [Candidatus Paceibacterota bacterium]
MNNHITVIFGHRGSGKTTFLFRNLESWKPFVLVDPLYDKKFETLNLHVLETVTDALELFKNGSPQRVYISPDLQTFDFFCGMCLAKRNITMVIDEIDNYATNYYISPMFKKVIKYGRHRGVNVVMVARRPKEMHPLIRSQASRFIIFPISGEDVREMSEHIGPAASRLITDLKIDDKGADYIDYNFDARSYSVKRIEYCNSSYKNTL